MNAMKTLRILFVPLGICLFLFMSCDKEEVAPTPTPPTEDVEINPTDINEKGFELIEKMQGHWIGYNQVLSWEWDWFAFDYRPISPSHVFGIYEGGTLGNLFTSFFVTDFEGTRTIMARNGGVLSGIYRTSYFVLDSVRHENGSDYYRLVDAIGGQQTMYMELSFTDDSLYWNAYTSRLGENVMPTRHFSFRGEKKHLELANNAAVEVGFPQNTPTWDFSDGFMEEYLYVIPGEEKAKSASFLAQAENNDVFTLADASGDPFRIQDHDHIGALQVDINRNTEIDNDKLFLYLSFESLTDANGYMLTEPFESTLLFPDIASTRDEFLFTYLHPGDYYLTIIADHNDDGIPGAGDITHVSQAVTIQSNGQHQISITDINIQN